MPMVAVFGFKVYYLVYTIVVRWVVNYVFQSFEATF